MLSDLSFRCTAGLWGPRCCRWGSSLVSRETAVWARDAGSAAASTCTVERSEVEERRRELDLAHHLPGGPHGEQGGTVQPASLAATLRWNIIK